MSRKASIADEPSNPVPRFFGNAVVPFFRFFFLGPEEAGSGSENSGFALQPLSCGAVLSWLVTEVKSMPATFERHSELDGGAMDVSIAPRAAADGGSSACRATGAISTTLIAPRS